MPWAGVVAAIIVGVIASLVLWYRNPPVLMPIRPNCGRRHPVVRWPSSLKPDKCRVVICMHCGLKIDRSGQPIDN